MATLKWLSDYAAKIGGIKDDPDATEGSYRTPIETMLQDAANEFGADVDILQEPGRAKGLGSPDFRVSSKGGGIVGYVECKAPGANLHELTTKTQIQKYRALSENILFTDSFRWLYLRGGDTVADVRLSDRSDYEAASGMLRTFLTADATRIGNSGHLAAALAQRCAMLRKGLALYKGDKTLRLNGLLGEFRKALDENMDFPRFADVFAQTLIYSLLMAKINSPAGDKLTLSSASERITENFAVIRQITTFLGDLQSRRCKDVRWIVDDILAIINEMDGAEVAKSMSYKKGISDGDDPYLNFYEKFLKEYDPKLRKSRGVFYTPPQVVKFIVRAADDLLKRDFGIPAGFAAQDKVTALDFAVGTGTFMLEMARLMLDGKAPAKRDILARGHFLQNFYGFESMASAYVISHLKLSRFLEDNGIAIHEDERIKVYLTNTLEKVNTQIDLPMLPELASEALDAQKVKDSPVLAIVGNPPYSGHSQNKGKWIKDLLHGIDDGKQVGGSYYKVDGKPLDEKTTKWLLDDYVKFIRFAQRKMDKVPRGIVAIITNHSFLDNPTFRGMRQSLMNTFDALYFLDLHGNTKKGEKAPDGGDDQNVFDIQQGVSVNLLVKSPTAKQKGVFHADMWGSRDDKNAACARESVDTIQWDELNPVSPYYYFIPRNEELEKIYNTFYPISDIFSESRSGILTARDKFTIDFDKDTLRKRVEAFIGMTPEEARRNLGLGADNAGWKVVNARQDLLDSEVGDDNYCGIAYRPFDTRHTCYTGNSSGFHCRPRDEVMRHMFAGDNLGLTTVRQVKSGKTWQHCFATANILESTFISNKTAEVGYLFPLYLYGVEMGKTGKRENFTDAFRRWIDNRYGEAHTPEDILGCIYAALHSPDYRKRYADFLRTDFPRIPFPENNDEFKRLAAIGGELMNAHLLRANYTVEYGELDGDGTSHKMENVRYDEKSERLYFNKAEYFAPIPSEIFNFQIGCYNPLDKFLKSRKGRELSPGDIDTMEKAANAIAFTIKKMAEIDG